jgi:hypothetical protein
VCTYLKISNHQFWSSHKSQFLLQIVLWLSTPWSFSWKIKFNNPFKTYFTRYFSLLESFDHGKITNWINLSIFCNYRTTFWFVVHFCIGRRGRHAPSLQVFPTSLHKGPSISLIKSKAKICMLFSSQLQSFQLIYHLYVHYLTWTTISTQHLQKHGSFNMSQICLTLYILFPTIVLLQHHLSCPCCMINIWFFR